VASPVAMGEPSGLPETPPCRTPALLWVVGSKRPFSQAEKYSDPAAYRQSQNPCRIAPASRLKSLG